MTQGQIKQRAIEQRAIEQARIKRRMALVALMCMVVGAAACAVALGMIYASVWPALLVAGGVTLAIGIFIGVGNG